MAITRFEDLEVWKEAMRQAVDIGLLFRDSNDYGFRDQIRRAAVSVPSNIAEGFDRHSNKDFVRFLRIAMGSNAEVRTQLYLARAYDYIDAGQSATLIDRSNKISAQLWKLINKRLRDFE